MICCTIVTALGCFTHCDIIDTHIRSEYPNGSVFRVCYDLQNAKQCDEVEIDNGNNIVFSHNSTLTGHHNVTIYAPDNETIGCFSYYTQLTIKPTTYD